MPTSAGARAASCVPQGCAAGLRGATATPLIVSAPGARPLLPPVRCGRVGLARTCEWRSRHLPIVMFVRPWRSQPVDTIPGAAPANHNPEPKQCRGFQYYVHMKRKPGIVRRPCSSPSTSTLSGVHCLKQGAHTAREVTGSQLYANCRHGILNTAPETSVRGDTANYRELESVGWHIDRHLATDCPLHRNLVHVTVIWNVHTSKCNKLGSNHHPHITAHNCITTLAVDPDSKNS